MSYKAESRTHTLIVSAPTLIGIYALLFGIFWAYTGFTTTNLTNWFLENTLTIPFLILLYFLYRWHRFSNLAITLIFVFLMLHVYGSQHTYAENLFGFWLQDRLQLERNHFDRIVHFGFGFLLAYPLHEIARQKLRLANWITYLIPLEITLSLGALYEVVEWLVADLFFPTQGDDFLGMQGDMWDAQKDIALALSGALISMSFVYLFRRRLKRID
jgi:putative membrane protein